MLSIVVVNWNGRALLPGLLGSLAAAREHLPWPLEVIVVDNASTDGSTELICELAPEVYLVQSLVNLGFAAGCNQGARAATFPYLLFLNPDTEVTATALEGAVTFMERTDQQLTGIVGVQLLDREGRITRSSSRFPRAAMFLAHNLGLSRLVPRWGHGMQEWTHGQTRVVEQVIGAFYLTRQALYARLGGFDERFFVYFEEVDYAYRALQLGYRSVYLADVQVFHEGEGTTSQVKGRRLFYLLRSRLLYGRKHYGPAENLLNFVNTLVIEPLSRAVFFKLTGQGQELLALREGFTLLYQDLPAILGQGRRT